MIIKFEIKHTGKIVGLNEYKSLHWRKLKKKTDALKFTFNSLLSKTTLPKLKWIELRVYHNTRFDLDNIAGTIKVFVDCLRHKKILLEDDRKYWDFLSVQYNPELKKNTLSFEITGETYPK